MEAEEEEDCDDEDQDAKNMTELRFVPCDKGQLDAMYTAMTFCQSLHPDPQSEHSDEENDEDEYLDADEDAEDHLGGGDNQLNGTQNTAVNGWAHGHGDGDEDMETDGQFEDAEEND